jgi:2-iminobutanoate/2-iminopropanoate deaminase
MKKTIKNPAGIAQPLSNYSHVVRVEIADTALLFVAGQIALDLDGQLVGKNDISAQTEFVFQEIEAILKGEGATLRDVVKANIYVTDMTHYKEVAAVRNRYFAVDPPATTFVEVSKLAREGLLVEIEVQAVVQL